MSDPTNDRTFAIIKPDAWARNRVGSILHHAESIQLYPDHLWLGQISEADWREFYSEHEGKPFFGALVHFMASGPCVLTVLKGSDAIQRWRWLCGSTDPLKAEEGSLRRLYGLGGAANAVHGSDSYASFVREVRWAERVSQGAINLGRWG